MATGTELVHPPGGTRRISAESSKSPSGRMMRCFERAAALFGELGDGYYQAAALRWLGRAHRGYGNRAAADTAGDQASDILHRLGHPEPAEARRVGRAG